MYSRLVTKSQLLSLANSLNIKVSSSDSRKKLVDTLSTPGAVEHYYNNFTFDKALNYWTTDEVIAYARKNNIIVPNMTSMDKHAICVLIQEKSIDNKLIAEGTHGKIRNRLINGKVYCAKILRIFDDACEFMFNMVSIETPTVIEAFILKFCNHPNILKPLSMTVNGKKLEILMEKHPHTLAKLRTKEGSLFLDPKNRTRNLKLLRQITSAIEYIHRHSIIHRDIKSENIIIDASGNAKLIDFGLSIFDEGQEKSCNVQAQSYRAPEVFKEDKNYTNAIDVWSLGCLIWEFATGKYLFVRDDDDPNEDMTIEYIYRHLGKADKSNTEEDSKYGNESVSLPEGFQDPLYESLLKMCLKQNPSERATAAQVLEVIDKELYNDNNAPKIKESWDTYKVPIVIGTGEEKMKPRDKMRLMFNRAMDLKCISPELNTYSKYFANALYENYNEVKEDEDDEDMYMFDIYSEDKKTFINLFNSLLN